MNHAARHAQIARIVGHAASDGEMTWCAPDGKEHVFPALIASAAPPASPIPILHDAPEYVIVSIARDLLTAAQAASGSLLVQGDELRDSAGRYYRIEKLPTDPYCDPAPYSCTISTALPSPSP